MAYNSTSWTTQAITKAGSSGENTVGGVTQYAYFGISSKFTSLNVAGGHYPLYFNMGYPNIAELGDQVPNLGNGTDPSTSFTFADATDQRASEWVPYLWYLPDNIYIDSVYSLEGADAATGDTTRFHLMGYTFTSGSTSALSSGTLLAHNSDTTNAGSEQAYLSTWTIDSASVTLGKVIVATFESDSTNSDYGYQVIVKYHLI